MAKTVAPLVKKLTSDDQRIEDYKNKEIKEYRDKLKTPLDEFKNYESYITTGPDFFKEQEYYGAPYFGFGAKMNVPYPRLLEAYSKSKGKFADKALTDPEIKKYFDQRLAERASLYDRVRKVPADKRLQFLNDYGRYADPFDYEGEPSDYADEKSIEDFIEQFDYFYGDWDTLKRYLDEWGF